jgi:lipopolysaccharide transport system ATP-binding protein
VLITVENLGKLYRLGPRTKDRYLTFRDTLSRGASEGLRRLLGGQPPPTDATREFWALRDVSFEVAEGQRLGVIGRNGAGKSTLLKLLSRITKPTEGRIRMRGRIGSLLEVGTGFHPELTGRENIFLNGAVLGMSTGETRRKFDEIVAFADVEQFLDTPVKRYSSGMYVRLAFAVAAHLEPEILIVDEVLAVGDAEFQRKCLAKMEEIGNSGRTVLFVSHNMTAIEQMCDSALLLERGHARLMTRDVRAATRLYLESGAASHSEWRNEGGAFANPYFTPSRLTLVDGRGAVLNGAIANNDEAWVLIEGEIGTVDAALTIGFALYGPGGQTLWWSYATDGPQESWTPLSPGPVSLRAKLPRRLLNEGTYRVDMLSSLHFREWLCQPGGHVPSIDLTISGGLSESPYFATARPTLLSPVLDWTVETKAKT